MNVDRARFLLLTTALSAATAVAMSASGCTVVSDDTKDGGATVPTPGTDSGADAYTADAYTADSSTRGRRRLSRRHRPRARPARARHADCASLCQHYVPNYKNGVGRAITECILKLPSCTGVDAVLAKCVQDALAQACPDPTAEDFCAPLSTSCGPGDGGVGSLPLSKCNPVAAGLNTTGRAALSACLNDGMDAGYCVADPDICINDIE